MTSVLITDRWRETRRKRNNWRTEEIHDAGNGKGIFFEEAPLVSEAQDPNVEQYTKVAAAVQNAIQCYCVIYDEKKRATAQTSLDRFFKRVDRIESSKEPEPVPSTSGMSETAACPPSPVADDPSALPSPTVLPPPVSNSSCLFTQCQPLYANCCTVLLYFSRYCTVRLKCFTFCVCFLCIICVKSIINLFSTLLYRQLC